MASSPVREVRRPRAQRAFTLIEVIVSIVVLAIAVAGVVGSLSAIAVRSANAMVNEQAVAIASSYLNEVLQKPFGAADGKVIRSQLDVVDDYAGLTDVGVHDQTGAPVGPLGQYTVTVTVRGGGLAGLPAAPLGGVLAAQLREVDVTVSDASGVLVVLSGYRTLYP